METKQAPKPRDAQLLADQRVAANIVTDVLLELKAMTAPGVSLEMLDAMAEKMILERGGTPYNKGYKPDWSETPYPATICCSVDYEICHAPPRGRSLVAGTIVKYDIGVRYKTGCGDAALTVPVDDMTNRQERLMRYTLRALYDGIAVVKAGVPISSIGRAIEKVANIANYNIIKEFGGHHIGREMHEKPDIPHVSYAADDNVFLEEGAVICIEPMLTTGKGQMRMAKEDGWTAFVPDGEPVAMFEHMILVTKDGYEVLTKHLTIDDDRLFK